MNAAQPLRLPVNVKSLQKPPVSTIGSCTALLNRKKRPLLSKPRSCLHEYLSVINICIYLPFYLNAWCLCVMWISIATLFSCFRQDRYSCLMFTDPPTGAEFTFSALKGKAVKLAKGKIMKAALFWLDKLPTCLDIMTSHLVLVVLGNKLRRHEDS